MTEKAMTEKAMTETKSIAMIKLSVQ